jgi:hypothetical protein
VWQADLHPAFVIKLQAHDARRALLLMTEKQKHKQRWAKKMRIAADYVFKRPATRGELKRVRKAWVYLTICAKCADCHARVRTIKNTA